MTDRDKGKAMMKAVYGWDIGEPNNDFVEHTIDHLFGEIWARDTLSIRERRMLLIGMLVGSAQEDVVEIQLDAAKRIGELTAEEMREIVVFLAYYAGWPRAAKLNQVVEKLLA